MGKPELKLSGWMGAAMWVEGDRLVIRRPPTGKTKVPLSMVTGFVPTNAAVGQGGYRVVVAGGSIHQSTAGSLAVSSDPYLVPLKPGRKHRDAADAFGREVMALVAASSPASADQGASGAGRLRELATLRDEGVITEGDFEDAKKRFLADG